MAVFGSGRRRDTHVDDCAVWCGSIGAAGEAASTVAGNLDLVLGQALGTEELLFLLQRISFDAGVLQECDGGVYLMRYKMELVSKLRGLISRLCYYENISNMKHLFYKKHTRINLNICITSNNVQD